MKLVELLNCIDENVKVELWDVDKNNLLETYNGRDSIDERYNDCEIDGIWVVNNVIRVAIDYVKVMIERLTDELRQRIDDGEVGDIDISIVFDTISRMYRHYNSELYDSIEDLFDDWFRTIIELDIDRVFDYLQYEGYREYLENTSDNVDYLLDGNKPSDIIRMVQDGSYDFNDEYVYIDDGYGTLESCCEDDIISEYDGDCLDWIMSNEEFNDEEQEIYDLKDIIVEYFTRLYRKEKKDEQETGSSD